MYHAAPELLAGIVTPTARLGADAAMFVLLGMLLTLAGTQTTRGGAGVQHS
jgi:hypothetical protein